MNNALLILILELIVIILISLGVIYIFILRRRIDINNRLEKYTIVKKKEEKSFFDNFFGYYDILINKTTKLLYRIRIFDTYSLKYNKYIKKEDKDRIDRMDFISKKVLTGIVFIVIVVIFNIVRYAGFNSLQLIFSFLIGFFTVDILLVSTNKFLRHEKENDLLKAITIMNNSFKSGRSIMQAIKLVATELDTPLGIEFEKMYVDLTYGLSLDVVFKRFEERVKIDEVKYITTSLNILDSSGGDIVKVFSEVEKTFFNNKKLHDELKNLTASSKMLYYMLTFIPFIFVILIFILDPTYFTPLFTNPLGIVILLFIIILYVGYLFIVKRIMMLEKNL